jgi:hypothetical protein
MLTSKHTYNHTWVQYNGANIKVLMVLMEELAEELMQEYGGEVSAQEDVPRVTVRLVSVV